jgi:hypothetical protein
VIVRFDQVDFAVLLKNGVSQVLLRLDLSG